MESGRACRATALPLAAYAVAARIDGRSPGLLAGLAAIWLTAVIRRVVTGCAGLLTISALVLTVQIGLVLVTGEFWHFLLQFPLANLCMCVLFARTAGGQDPLAARPPRRWSRCGSPANIILACTASSRARPGRASSCSSPVALAVLMVTEATGLFLLLSALASAALIVVGTGASTLWLLSLVRMLGRRLRFARA